MNEKQERIHTGLKRIGEEVAAFYLDGVDILNDKKLRTSTHLLAHCAREIDSALRQTFSTKQEEAKIKSQVDEKLKKQGDHIVSILSSLNISTESQLAKDWWDVGSRFGKFAHRDSSSKKPREKEVGIEIWEKYEDVLLRMIGGYFALQKRIERIISLEEPSGDVLDRLPFLIQHDGLKIQFFKGLSNPKWLKPLFELGYFSPDKIPSEYPAPDKEGYVVVPNWIEMQYLEKVAQENFKNPSSENTQILTSIINDFFLERQKGEVNNRNIDLPFTKLIFWLPSDEIGEEHFDHISRSLESQPLLTSFFLAEEGLVNFLERNEKGPILELMRTILPPTEIDGPFGKQLRLRVDYSPLRDNLLVQADSLLATCGLEIVNLPLEIIGNFSEDHLRGHSYVAAPEVSFDNEEEFGGEEPLALLCKFSTLFLEKYEGDITDKVRELLHSEILLFRRIAIHLLTKRYESIGNIFWEIPYNPFDQYEIENDLARFLKQNAKAFSASEIDQLIDWVEAFEDKFFSSQDKLTKEEYEAFILHQRRRRLTLLEESESENLQALLNELEVKDPSEITEDSLDFRPIRMSSSWGIEVPESANALSHHDALYISEYLKAFDEKDEFGRDNTEGAGYGLRRDIVENPAKYFENFELFVDVRPEFFSCFIDAVRDITKENEFVFWPKFLLLTESFLGRRDFWALRYSSGTIISLGRLLRDNLANDETAIAFDNMKLVKKVLLSTLSHLEPDTDPVSENKGVDILNNAYPVILTAILNYTLRMARNVFQEEKVKWEPEIKDIFDEGIQEKTSHDVFAIAGQFLRNFYYLDRDWFDENFTNIFPEEDNYFSISLSFYINHNPLCKPIHHKLKSEGYLNRAVRSSFIDSGAGGRLISHICLGYQMEWDNIEEDGLLPSIIAEMNIPAINHMVYHFWIKRSKDAVLPQNDTLVRTLWRQLHENIKDNTADNETSELASNLAKWIGSISDLDEESIEWVRLAAENCHVNHNEHFFFENLSRHVGKSPHQVGDLLIYYSKNTPEQVHRFATKDLERTIEAIYENLELAFSNEVCHSLGEIGYQRLYDIYNKYNEVE